MSGLPFERWKMTVRLLSPVHVGSGWELTPDEYVLSQDAHKDDWLEVVDRAAILRDLGETARKELDGVLARGDARGIQDWMMKRYDPVRHRRFKVRIQKVVAEALLGHLKRGSSQCIIALATRNQATGAPYLPGSSIKGALRTAYLAYRTAQQGVRLLQGGGEDDRDFQSRVLGVGAGDFGTDPFRQIAISDTLLKPIEMLIDQVKIVRLKPKHGHSGRGEEGILMFRDVTWSLADRVVVDGESEVRVHSELARRGHVSQPISIEGLVKSCQDHYLPALKSEFQSYAEIIDEDAARVILDAAEALGANETLIRIGRHSHFECMTIPNVRRPPRLGFGKTRSYVGGVIPLGWCRLSFERIG
jgi:CRISPR-associated protein Csm5